MVLRVMRGLLFPSLVFGFSQDPQFRTWSFSSRFFIENDDMMNMNI